MNPRVRQVSYLHDYVLELTFTNGTVAQLDFSDDLREARGVMLPLKDLEFFKRVRVDPQWGCIVWPNEVDYCPDLLYHRATGAPLPGQQSDAEVA